MAKPTIQFLMLQPVMCFEDPWRRHITQVANQGEALGPGRQLRTAGILETAEQPQQHEGADSGDAYGEERDRHRV